MRESEHQHGFDARSQTWLLRLKGRIKGRIKGQHDD